MDPKDDRAPLSAGQACPLPDSSLPASPPPLVRLAHGGGGRAMQELLRDHVGRALGPAPLRHDGAVLPGGIALTTDAYVVHPRVFPGGDIGRLAVFGTVNDLAMTGARAEHLALSLILEEGLPLSELDAVLDAVRAAADQVGVAIATGDTKVVERGKGDGVFIVTTGVGRVLPGAEVGPWRVRAGDAVLVSGDVGRHGAAVLSVRPGMAFARGVESDCSPVHGPALALLEAGLEVHCMRDCTRGGTAAALHEIAQAAGLQVVLEEALVPVHPAVRGATEVLGLDPLHLACEGRFVLFLPAAQATAALAVLRDHPVSAGAALIGRVEAGGPDPGAIRLWMTDAFGQERPVIPPLGEPLPRIC